MVEVLQKWEELDANDPLSGRRDLFDLPEGMIYLDGNSLGALPKSVSARMKNMVEEQWGQSLITGWNKHGWMDMPARVGERLAKIVGAEEGTVLATDITSINVFKLLATAVKMRPERKVILSDTANFPTDLYMAQGLVRLLDAGHELKIVDPEEIYDALDESIAVMLLSEVEYKSGRRYDMAKYTEKAHSVGALVIWDLCHSAGAFEVELDKCNADFAVGCGYKYLNGGPGAPAFVYAAKRHHDTMVTPLSGWHGHEAPFAFDLDYRACEGIDQMRVGTPSVLSLAALDAALDAFEGVDMAEVRAKSVALCDLFIEEVERRCPEVSLVTPRNADERGSQVSFAVEEGYAVMQALIANGVVGDFRAPNIIRFGFTPLYVSYGDVVKAAETVERVLRERLWDTPEFKKRAKVT
ncbi:kynureninase [Rhodobacteraceae bacterium RKSG542]|uniref:kynureninase n=1 Tax=Pseudovibrio flavus TaxID=2529854 RepID=UPI0012BCDB5B|nr:kynureninase [Pseudovibrio flavus]MTI17262.1 kynureninase [Pseudovibrio flavus]